MENEENSGVKSLQDYLKYDKRKSREYKSNLRRHRRNREREREQIKLEEKEERKKIRQQKKMEKRKYKGVGIKRKIAVLTLASIAIGSTAIGITQAYNGEKKDRSLGDVLKSETLEELGITKNHPIAIDQIKDKLNSEDITDKEIIALAPIINDLKEDILNSKISKELHCEKEDIDIRKYVVTNPPEVHYCLLDNKNRVAYRESDIFTYENIMDSTITEYISKIYDMDEIADEIKKKDYDKDNVIKYYKDAINDIEKFAAKKITIDEKGKIEANEVIINNQDKQTKQTQQKNQKEDEERS